MQPRKTPLISITLFLAWPHPLRHEHALVGVGGGKERDTKGQENRDVCFDFFVLFFFKDIYTCNAAILLTVSNSFEL